jgi:hypothetical protein
LISRDDVLQVVEEMIPLLFDHGHRDKADWLAQQCEVLRDSAATSATLDEVRARLHDVVPRMGGLMDLRLEDSPDETTGSARAALDRLAEQLYELTR